jgi:hypothetical protein
MVWGGVVETELMPKLVGGETETVCGGKLKKCKGFLKPNFETLPKLRQVRLYGILKMFSGRLDEGLLVERGLYPGGRDSSYTLRS